ncbi:galanin receptor 2a-like [Haliotis asinina]|uniref:galanin receptor 2a-like n=1 Tax=Haliotis asinina TaxID=109174 RepID=UPI00353279A2
MNDSNSSIEEGGGLLPNEETADLLWQIISPILILVGTVGNLLSIVVLTRKGMRKSNVSKYLTCLAVADLAVIYTGLLSAWIKHMFDVTVSGIHEAACKIHTWLLYSSLHTSAWILVSVTIERTVFVWNPLRYKVFCTKRIATLCMISVTGLCLLLNSHFLFFFVRTETDTGVYECDAGSRVEYEYFLSKVFHWVDMCVWCIAPVLVHLVCNILIIYRLRRQTRTFQAHNSTAEADRVRQRLVASMTTMLLSLNLVYLLCTLPVSVFFVGEQHWRDIDPGMEAEATRELTKACVCLIMYLNNSTNFIICLVKGKRFRKEVSAIFTCGRTRGPTFQQRSISISHISRSFRQMPIAETSSSSLSDIIGLRYRRYSAQGGPISNRSTSASV